MTELWIYEMVCPGVDLTDHDSINRVLRRMAELYCYDNKPEHDAVDDFIRFHQWNVAHGSVPCGTYEAFGCEEDERISDWECEALEVEEKLVKRLHSPRDRYRKR
jgi:hypothetical protein